MSVQAVVLAGGSGKRIRPLGIGKPKSMFEILGKPLIQHVLENLCSAGITDVIVVTGANDHQIRRHLGGGDDLAMRIRYTEQPQPLGQANALLTSEKLITGNFVVLNANDIFEPSLIQAVVNKAADTRADVVLVGRNVTEPNKFGVMRFDNYNRLVGVVEKPPVGEEPSSVAVVGVYYFSPRIFDSIRATPLGETDDQLERAYQHLIDEGKGDYVPYGGLFASFKHPWDLLTINELLLHQLPAEPRISSQATISDRAVIEGKVIIENGVRVFEGAVIRGPVYVGRNSIIGNGVLVRNHTSIGRQCVIGYGTEISRSILGNGVWTHKNFIGDSIIADNCSFGAGTITANLRFDEQEVYVRVGEQKVSTAMSHFGVIMADSCRTGCNAVLAPGVKIGPNSIVGPGVVLKQDLPPDKIALLSASHYEVRDNRLDVRQLSRDERMATLRTDHG